MEDVAPVAFTQRVAEHLRARADVLDSEAAELLEASSRDTGRDFGHGEYDAAHKRRYAAGELRAAADAALAVVR